jgi:hypothetical protein
LSIARLPFALPTANAPEGAQVDQATGVLLPLELLRFRCVLLSVSPLLAVPTGVSRSRISVQVFCLGCQFPFIPLPVSPFLRVYLCEKPAGTRRGSGRTS